METKRVRFVEHLAVATPMSLQDFCNILRREFELPAFTFDPFSGESPHVVLFSLDGKLPECGFVEKDGIEYNISRYMSRPFEPETLQLRDITVPDGCNFGVVLVVSNDCAEGVDMAWGSSELVPRVARKLARVLGQKVHHHRTSVYLGKLTERETIVQKSIFPAGE
jgi:hypothetical protein